MKIFLKALAVFVLAALGAGVVIYADNHCPKKQAKLQQQINQAIESYVANNAPIVLENIAKTQEFSQVIQNFTAFDEKVISEKINNYFATNPVLFENYVHDNAQDIARILLQTDEFKSYATNSDNKEVSEDAHEEQEDTNKIYKEHWDEMINSEVAPTVGPKDAKVVIVEFFDFACGHCKALAPVMSQVMKNNPDVRFIYNPLFFISEHSPYAAKVALAAAEKGKFAEVYKGIMTLPDMNEETINQILVDEGLNIDEIKKMIEEKKIRRGIQDIDALSQVLGVNGVPMLLINGEAFYGRNLDDIQNKINSYK